MRVLGGRGVAALIRDVSADADMDETSANSNPRIENPHLTPPELRARIRESLSPIFFDDSAAISRKIESLTHPIRNDLTLASFAQLRGGKLHAHDTKRMNEFRAQRSQRTRKDTDTK